MILRLSSCRCFMLVHQSVIEPPRSRCIDRRDGVPLVFVETKVIIKDETRGNMVHIVANSPMTSWRRIRLLR